MFGINSTHKRALAREVGNIKRITRMKNKFAILGLITFTFGVLTILILNNSCQKDCSGFNYSECPSRDAQYIIVKFNMDSINNGFTKEELVNFEITFAGDFYSEKRQPVIMFLGYDENKFIFKAMFSFYCCGDGNAGFKMFNNNTNRVQVVDNVKFTEERPYDYCCGNYYTVKRFDFNGNRKSGGDTIFIDND